jgi:hypothetical protein
MNTTRQLIITVIAVLLLAGCTLEASDNSKLNGYWQLTTVDTLATGHSIDYRDQLIFWAVQANLLEIRDLKRDEQNILFRFRHEGDKLTLSQPIIDDRTVSDIVVDDPSLLSPYGFTSIEETFTVRQLTNSNMTLVNQCYGLHFRKY